MYRNVLLAIDMTYEDSWSHAVPPAVETCRHDGATLHVMMVVPDFGMSIVGSFFPAGYEKEALEKAREHLHAFCKEHVPGDIEVKVHVGHGRPYEQILAVARDLPADLIVMGAAQKSLLRRLFSGDETEPVLRQSKIPVLVIPEAEDG